MMTLHETMLLAAAPLRLSGNGRIAAAILYGLMVGIFLVKSELATRQSCLEALTFRNPRPIKTVLSALAIGMFGFVLLRRWGFVTAHVPNANFWSTLLGGVIAGVGFSMAGLTLLTATAALGSGRLYAFWLLLGMGIAAPAANWCAGQLNGLISHWTQPLQSSLEPSGGLFAWNSPVLWIGGLCILAALTLHLLLGGGDQD